MSSHTFRFIFTLLSLLTAPVLALASIPFWHFEVARENPNDPTGFGIFGVIFGVVVTAFVGAVAGAVFAILAHRRHERFFPVRLLTLAGNVAVLSYVIYTLCTWPGGLRFAE
jgi:hypothetical protein